MTAHRTLDLTSSLEVGPATNNASGDASSNYNARSVLTIAFQFPFENSLLDNIAAMARQYVRSVISSVQRVAMAISPSRLNPTVGPKLSPGSPEALALAHWICQSYRHVALLFLLVFIPYLVIHVQYVVRTMFRFIIWPSNYHHRAVDLWVQSFLKNMCQKIRF